METKEKSVFRDTEKQFIDDNGVFKIRVCGTELDVMLFNDFKKSNGITQYEFLKKELNGEVKRLYIAGRSRNSSVVVVSGEITEITSDLISDKNGYFEAMVGGIFKKCIFVDQYAQHQKITKPGITKRANSRKSMFETYFIKTATSNVPLCLVVLKK